MARCQRYPIYPGVVLGPNSTGGVSEAETRLAHLKPRSADLVVTSGEIRKTDGNRKSEANEETLLLRKRSYLVVQRQRAPRCTKRRMPSVSYPERFHSDHCWYRPYPESSPLSYPGEIDTEKSSTKLSGVLKSPSGPTKCQLELGAHTRLMRSLDRMYVRMYLRA